MTISRNSVRSALRLRVFLSLSTILAAGFTAPAFAADPVYRNLDGNGVDLVFDDLVVNFPEGSIGSGQAELSLIRVISNGTLTANWDSYGFALSRSGSALTVRITKPDRRSDTFTGTTLSSTFTAVGANGSALTKDSSGTYVYSMADGTSVTFVNPDYDVVPAPPNGLCSPGSPQSGCTLIPSTVTDPRGNSINLQFDSPLNGDARKLLGVSNSFGYAIAFSYSGYTRTGAIFMRDGATVASVSYGYPAGGGIDITDMAGATWHLTSTSITRPGESSPSFSVGGSATAVSSVTRDGVATQYARTVSGNTGTMVVTDALGHTNTIVSNLTIGRPTSATDALGKTTYYSYDTYGRLTRATQPEGNYVNYTYDTRGNVTETRVVAKAGSGVSDIIGTASFPSTCGNVYTCNQPTSTIDPRGNVTDYTYDPGHGGVLSVTAPAPTPGAVRPQTRYSYTAASGALGDVFEVTSVSACRTTASCVGTPDETKTTLAYDSYGALSSITQAAGDNSLSATTTATYTALGDVATVDGPLPGAADSTTFRYDAARRRVGVISADPDGAGALKRRAQKTTYDTAGRVTVSAFGTVAGTGDSDWAAFAGAQALTTSYTNSRRATEVVSGGGTPYQVTQYGYDALGRPECTALRMNGATWGGLPASACTLSTPGSAGPDRIGKLTYDDAGRVVRTQSAVGTADQADDATSTYSDNGRTLTLTDANGNRTSYAYDGMDRLLRTNYPSAATGAGASSATDYEQLGYDAGGNVTSRRLRDGRSIGFAYDALGRMTVKDIPGGSAEDVYYAYDLQGRLLSARFGSSAGQGIVDAYDALGRMSTTTNTMGGVGRSLGYQYDAGGNRTRLTHGDGVYFDYARDAAGRMTGASWWTAATGTVPFFGISYDDLGRRTGTGRASSTSGYGYDAASRLASVTQSFAGAGGTTATFGYNPAGQIASKSQSNDDYAFTGSYNVDRAYATNGLNQHTGAGPATFTYDANGNLTGDGSRTYGYDAENRLVSSGTVTLSYDPLGRLWQTAGGGYGNTQFVYDGDSLVAEYDGDTGGMRRRYFHGPGTDEPVLWDEGSAMDCSGTKVLHGDERGSIVAVADCFGNRVAVNTYDEYGIPGSGNFTPWLRQRFQYTGQAWIPELGMYYYKARMYSPTLGRFMQTDPIGYGDGMNWYNYVGGDPVNGIDPTGLVCAYVTGSHTRRCDNDLVSSFAQVGISASLIPTIIRSYDAGGGSGTGAEAGSSQQNVMISLILYPTTEAAALAAIDKYNPLSIANNKEALGTVYPVFGQGYTYSYPTWLPATGGSANVSCFVCTAFYHLHAADSPLYNEEIFSREDRIVARGAGVPMYLGTPMNHVLVFNPFSGTTVIMR